MTMTTDRGISTDRGTDWQDRGHCATDPEPFHYTDTADADEALRICRGTQDNRPACPVQHHCLTAGITGSQWGVWGGQFLNGGHK